MSIPYSGLKSVNVDGTLRMIRLALESGAHLHYVSSAGVLSSVSDGEDWIQWTPLQMNEKDGYSQTKAVSERLLFEASRSLGLPVRIFRCSSISGHSINGYSNHLDFINLLLQACVKVKAAVMDTSVRLHSVPIDFVCKSIVLLSKSSVSEGKVFHLIGDGKNVSFLIEADSSCPFQVQIFAMS